MDHGGIAGESSQKLRKALDEFDTYVVANEALIPNYGERWRNEEAIATGFVESAVNQIVSKRFSKKQPELSKIEDAAARVYHETHVFLG